MQYSSVSVDNKIPFQRVSFKMTAPSALVKGRIVRLQVASDGAVTMVAGNVPGSDSTFATNPAALFGVVDKDAVAGSQVLIIVSGIVEVSCYGRDSDHDGAAILSGDCMCRNEGFQPDKVSGYGAVAKAGDVILGIVLGEIGVEKVASGAAVYANVLFDGISKFPQR